jgi:hypothetical protein
MQYLLPLIFLLKKEEMPAWKGNQTRKLLILIWELVIQNESKDVTRFKCDMAILKMQTV